MQQTKSSKIGIVYGIHGDEYTPLIIQSMLRDKVSNGELVECELFGPINSQGLIENTRIDPEIGMDINRLFGRNKNTCLKTFSLFNQLMECGYVIDLHSFVGKPTLPTIYYSDTGEEKAVLKTKMMVKSIDLPIKKRMLPTEGVLGVELVKSGVPAITIEVSPIEQIQTAELVYIVEEISKAILDGFTNGNNESVVLHKSVAKKTIDKCALFIPTDGCRPGVMVSKDQILGKLIDLVTQQEEKLLAQESGLIQSIAVQGYYPENTEIYIIVSEIP